MIDKTQFIMGVLYLNLLQVVGRNNGEDSLARWPTTSGMMAVEDACVEILKYLEKVWGTLSSSGWYKCDASNINLMFSIH